jgi:hypothetical protein
MLLLLLLQLLSLLLQHCRPEAYCRAFLLQLNNSVEHTCFQRLQLQLLAAKVQAAPVLKLN